MTMARSDSETLLLALGGVEMSSRMILSRVCSSRILWSVERVTVVVCVGLFLSLMALHTHFVRKEGCAGVLRDHGVAECMVLGRGAKPSGLCDVVEVSVTRSGQGWKGWVGSQLAEETCRKTSGRVDGFRFSREKGLLLLSKEAYTRYNATALRVQIPSEHVCFQKLPGMAALMEYFVGYETAILNAFVRVMKDFAEDIKYSGRNLESASSTRDQNDNHPGSLGYLYVENTHQLYNLAAVQGSISIESLSTKARWLRLDAWNDFFRTKAGAIATSLFLMCTTSSLVTYALREVQVRLLKLSLELQQHIRTHQPTQLVMLRHVRDGLVFVPMFIGNLFFLVEFFNDERLAFVVIIVTWLCEFFSMITRRHRLSAYYLPRLFFAYFLAFHIYFFSFPRGYTGLALITCVAFMANALLIIWRRWEIPSLRNTGFDR